MTVHNSLLKALLNKEFFDQTKPYLIPRMFPDTVKLLWDVISYAHNKHDKAKLGEPELLALFSVLNPSATTATKNVYRMLVDELLSAPEMDAGVAAEAIAKMSRKELLREIAEKALDGSEGGSVNFAELTKLIEMGANNTLPAENYKIVSDDIDKLLEEASDGHRWLFNVPGLRDKVGGIGHGEFAVFFARPECGKTAFHVSAVAGPNGFIAQGANVHCIVNEEPAYRTMLRAVSSYTGLDTDQIKADPGRAKELFNPVKGRLKYIDSVDFTVEGMDAYVRKHKPDILVVDQLDKIHVDGSFARTDERLKAIYVFAREIAKRNGISVIGISQASAEAEGKTIMSMDQLENSRTGKAAEADLIIGIGKSPMSAEGEDNPARVLNVLKNKITGWHGVIPCMLRNRVSRYEA